MPGGRRLLPVSGLSSAALPQNRYTGAMSQFAGKAGSASVGRGALLAMGFALIGCGGETSEKESRTEQASGEREDGGTKTDMSSQEADDDVDQTPDDDDVDQTPDDDGVEAPAQVDPVEQPTTPPTMGAAGPASMNPVPIDPESPAAQPNPIVEPAPIANPDCVSLPQATEVEIARRLERLLWNVETGELAELVAAGDLELDTTEAIVAQANTMLADSRSEAGLVAFVKNWFNLDGDYAALEGPLLASVLESTDRTIAALVAEDAQGVSGLLVGNTAVIDGALASFYEVDAPDTGWELVQLPEARNLGLLTQAHWLSFAPNAPWRGAEVRRSLTCLPVPPPPPGVVKTIPEPVEGSSREHFAEHATEPACASCHQMLDPLGFAFEHFDSDGAYRAQENGLPIDDSGALVDRNLEFVGTQGLAELLLGELSVDVATCLVQTAVGHAALGSDGIPGFRVPALEPGCQLGGSAHPELGLDASLQAWLLAIVASDTFRAAYD